MKILLKPPFSWHPPTPKCIISHPTQPQGSSSFRPGVLPPAPALIKSPLCTKNASRIFSWPSAPDPNDTPKLYHPQALLLLRPSPLFSQHSLLHAPGPAQSPHLCPLFKLDPAGSFIAILIFPYEIPQTQSTGGRAEKGPTLNPFSSFLHLPCFLEQPNHWDILHYRIMTFHTLIFQCSSLKKMTAFLLSIILLLDQVQNTIPS